MAEDWPYVDSLTIRTSTTYSPLPVYLNERKNLRLPGRASDNGGWRERSRRGSSRTTVIRSLLHCANFRLKLTSNSVDVSSHGEEAAELLPITIFSRDAAVSRFSTVRPTRA